MMTYPPPKVGGGFLCRLLHATTTKSTTTAFSLDTKLLNDFKVSHHSSLDDVLRNPLPGLDCKYLTALTITVPQTDFDFSLEFYWSL